MKEKGDGSAPVEEFSSAAAKIRRRRWRRGRRSRANISTTSCRVHLAVISSAATGFPQLFIESDTDTDANCNDGRQFGCCHISPSSPLPDFCPCQCRATTFSLFVRFSARERSRARIFHSTPAANYAITRKLAPRVGSGMEKVVFVDLTNEYCIIYSEIGDLELMKIWCKYYFYIWIGFVKNGKEYFYNLIICILKYIIEIVLNRRKRNISFFYFLSHRTLLNSIKYNFFFFLFMKNWISR